MYLVALLLFRFLTLSKQSILQSFLELPGRQTDARQEPMNKSPFALASKTDGPSAWIIIRINLNKFPSVIAVVGREFKELERIGQ